MKAWYALLLIVLVLGGLLASTEYTASELRDARELGDPWITVGAVRLYAPWAWIQWSARYESRAPRVFRNASGITTVTALLATGIVALLGARRKAFRSSNAHGSSRWATKNELTQTGMLVEDGVVLCQTAEASYKTTLLPDGGSKVSADRFADLVRHNGPEHVFCFAPTRSGKGVGLVIPTLLSWRHSVLVYDIKKENWAITAGWRKLFSHVWRFEPTATDSLRFNPLLEIRRGLDEVKDTQNIADILVDPNGGKDSKDHWQTTAHTLLTGAILHVLYAEPDKTLAGVAGFLSDPGRNQRDTLNRMLTTKHLGTGPHPVVAQSAREMMNKSDNELSGVFSSAMACLGLYRDPIIGRSTSASDFRIRDLMNAEHPVSLYLVVPPSDLDRTKPLIRLMLNQICRRLTESMEFGGKKAYRHRLLLLLDEFPSLGQLSFFETAMAFIAGYGLKAFLIGQSLNQLQAKYGKNNSILDNCHVRFTYAPNDAETAKTVSELLGQATERKRQVTYSGSGMFLSNRSESDQEYARQLLTSGEVAQLSQDEGILFVAGQMPYRAKKVRYFLDPRFKGRDGLPAPDSPEEQAAELLGPVVSDWDGFIVPTSSAETPSTDRRPNSSLPSAITAAESAPVIAELATNMRPTAASAARAIEAEPSGSSGVSTETTGVKPRAVENPRAPQDADNSETEDPIPL